MCVAAIAGLYAAKEANWFGESHAKPIIVPPEKSAVEIFTGAGSAEFSIYAPQYPGSTVIDASRFGDSNGVTVIASMTTPDSIGKVSDYYREALEEKGFDPRVDTSGVGRDSKIMVIGDRPSAGISVLVTIQSIPNNGTRIDLSDTTRTNTIS